MTITKRMGIGLVAIVAVLAVQLATARQSYYPAALVPTPIATTVDVTCPAAPAATCDLPAAVVPAGSYVFGVTIRILTAPAATLNDSAVLQVGYSSELDEYAAVLCADGVPGEDCDAGFVTTGANHSSDWAPRFYRTGVGAGELTIRRDDFQPFEGAVIRATVWHLTYTAPPAP